ncbi:phosphatidate cytidylyltransferase [Rubrivirga sp.]|uniref:phosphatidate cytidylyltransferase n=1 Tax=Rubrivirga sp. TaxID=1885344 RepID=UPI003C77083B
MSNLAQRILTGVVGAAIVVGALWVGGWVFALLMAAVAAAAQFELYGLLSAGETKPLVAVGLLVGLLATLWPVLPIAAPLLVVGVVLIPLTVLFLRRESPLFDAAGTVFGVVYPAALASSILVLRTSTADWMGDDGAFWLTLTVLFGVSAADTLAYTAGRLVGSRPLFERVSPKKTWEGSVGGLIGGVLFVALFKVFVLEDALSWLDVAVVGAIVGAVSQLGDLAESHFKRSVKIKDSATWLPGHGGLLDRIDAMVIAVPLVAVYLEVTKGLL